MIDLDAYLRRIGYSGPREPTLAVLTAICAAHPAAIAFENIDPLLGRPPSLAPDALQAKLVRQRRGGYCYEQNTLLQHALSMLGLPVTALTARVLWMRPRGAEARPRSHMLLKVELPADGAQGPSASFIADVGFGGHLLSAPLRLQPGVAQRTRFGHERITQHGASFDVEAELPDGWSALYRFALDAQLPADFEPLNWFTATHPGSIFRHNLRLERITPTGRAGLLNDRLTLRTPDAPPQVRRIESAAAFAKLLDDVFEIEPPVSAARLFASVPKGLDGPFMPA